MILTYPVIDRMIDSMVLSTYDFLMAIKIEELIWELERM